MGRSATSVLAAGGFAFDRDGAIVEQSPVRSEVAETLSARLATNGGAAIVIDYGYAAGEQGDTLQAVHAHRFAYVLDRPGEQDLTAHVDFAALREAARRGGAKVSAVVSQGNWLETLGIGAARWPWRQRIRRIRKVSPPRADGCATRRRWGGCSR
jgi:SAM-dependent MidA family methyltransferase